MVWTFGLCCHMFYHSPISPFHCWTQAVSVCLSQLGLVRTSCQVKNCLQTSTNYGLNRPLMMIQNWVQTSTNYGLIRPLIMIQNWVQQFSNYGLFRPLIMNQNWVKPFSNYVWSVPALEAPAELRWPWIQIVLAVICEL